MTTSSLPLMKVKKKLLPGPGSTNKTNSDLEEEDVEDIEEEDLNCEQSSAVQFIFLWLVNLYWVSVLLI